MDDLSEARQEGNKTFEAYMAKVEEEQRKTERYAKRAKMFSRLAIIFAAISVLVNCFTK